MKKLLILAGLALCFALPAHATGNVVGQHTTIANAGHACHSAREVYETSFRKRPLAVVNEGAQGIFVNCWFAVPQDPATR